MTNPFVWRNAFGFSFDKHVPRLVTRPALCYFGLVKKGAAKIETVSDYMRDVDRTLLRENLKLTPEQRLQKFTSFMRFTSELRRAGKTSRLRRKNHKQ